MPRALVEQAHPAAANGRERRRDVRHPVPDVVHALAPAGQEPADRGVRAERLKQLDPGRAAGRIRHPQHRLTDPLLLIDLAAHHGEVEDRLVEGDLGGEIVAGDSHMVDPVQHHCPLIDLAAPRYRGRHPHPGHHRGGRAEEAMPEAVITGGARTAVGRLLGWLTDFTAADLGGIVIKAALERSGLTGADPEYVIMGQVLQAGAGQIPARQAAVAAGIPMTVPAITVNKVCLSGLDAIALAAQLIRAREFDVVVAGGMESMTGTPHLLPAARKGIKYGSAELVDSMALDGLTDAFDHLSMGESTERHNTRLGI